MKRLLYLLVILFGFYYMVQIGFKLFDDGYTMVYNIKTGDNNFEISETYTQNVKNEIDNYYFNIKTPSSIFKIQTYESFMKANQIIKKIYYYKDDQYECIYPIFQSDKKITDVICKTGDNFIFYNSISNPNTELNNFINSLEEYNYNKSQFQGSNEILTRQENIIVYNNIIDKNYLALESYKGIYTINNRNINKLVKVNLFEQDIYDKQIHLFYENYYVTADYNKKYEFNDIIVYNTITNEKTNISSNKSISMDSFIQGGVNKKIYLFDKTNLKQYEIDLKTKTIIEVGNVDSETLYYNLGEWSKISAYDTADGNIKFNINNFSNTLKNISYSKVDKVGNTLSGYYYIYVKEGNEYKIYRSNVQDAESLIYLFKIKLNSKIVYYKDSVYYSYDNDVYYYSDKSGNKKIATNSEFEFNNSLIFGIYID